MKKFSMIFALIVSTNSFAYTVIDSLYETDDSHLYRIPAASESSFCIVDEDTRIFGKSCYTTQEHCEKRLEFWKDLPGVQPVSCVKI